MKHMSFLGKDIAELSKDMVSSVTMITSETDLKIFIDEHRSNERF